MLHRPKGNRNILVIAKRNHMGDIEIAYQNKDITSKVLAEHFRGKAFKVYGLELPQIVQVLPTNLPAVKANAATIYYDLHLSHQNHLYFAL